MKKYKFGSMMPKEIFDYVRSQTNRFSLRLRLTVMVSAELVFSAVLAAVVAMLLDPYFESDSSIFLSVTLLVTCVIVGSVVTAILSKLVYAPMKNVIHAMEQVADGDYSVRLNDSSSAKEVMEMYTGFNLMAHELEATEVLQTDFVSNVSHEFKTPINAIEGYTMLLQGGENLSEDEQLYLEKIIFNTRRLSTLVGSILLLSKLENQHIPAKKTAFRLDEQIRQSIVAMEPDWARKNVDFDVELEKIEFVGNEPMLRHVWDNLIANAVKFGPENGRVCMRLVNAGDIIRFTIEDEGCGLSDESIKHIYDKFYQADSSHKEEGNGLGLSLVKRILSLENGKIYAENLPDKGCRFTVELNIH